MDKEVYPVVHDGGIVEPGRSHCRIQESGIGGILNGPEGTRGSEAGKGERPSGWSWPSGGPTAGGSWSACTTTSFFSELKLSDEAKADFQGVAGAYPLVEFRSTSDLMWLINRLKPIRGLDESAILLTAYPLNPKYNISSWAWWEPGLIWIGPRHTNYVEASICAFEPSDGTWRRGQPLIKLLDLHVLWIVRHLYMRHFARWPGRQALHTAYERITEHRAGELCGCDSGKSYEECCQSRDKSLNIADVIIQFARWRRFRMNDRKPPIELWEFAYGNRNVLPSLKELPFIS